MIPMNATDSTELAVFDLDNTLLAGDSDYLWGQFLIESGHVERDSYEATNARFFEQYKAGTLDIHEFSHFSLSPLIALTEAQRQRLRRRFIEQVIKPIVAPGAADLLDSHRKAGHEMLITTATNRFITAPIAELFDIRNLLANEPEIIDGQYTGKLTGTPNFREGKITRLRVWINEQPRDFTRIHAYSDSHNDLPLLELADCPTAVDPDPQLRQHALQQGWPVISLRD